MRVDNSLAGRLPRTQLWIIGILSAVGIIALSYGWYKQSDPGILAILLLAYGALLPLILMAFMLIGKVGLKHKTLVFACCVLMSVISLSFAFFGETITNDLLGIGTVSYLWWPGREIHLGLSALSIVLCMGITLWQHSRQQS